MKKAFSPKESMITWLNVIEDVVYAVLALILVAVAILVLVAALEAYWHALAGGDTVVGVIDVIDKTLLALMVAEIFYTVMISFRSHALRPEPFIVVGLIAAVRRVLLISLEAAHASKTDSLQFKNFMVELAVLSVLIGILVMSLYVLRRRKDADATETSAETSEPNRRELN